MTGADAISRSPAAQAAGKAYRPDIDGLRAVAVLSVVLYHINRNLVPGGYVGVDIFFVISGFLITGNICSELARGHFSLSNFYVRRIHRIYPAFAVVTLATLLAGSLLMLPADMVRLARSAFWSAFSLPNVYFWKYLDTSYFAAAAEEEPLLHMWSLGVEEQFYFLWPAILIAAMWAFKRSRLAVIALAAVIAVMSFAYAQEFLRLAPKFTYYMLPARAGELMLGAILALAGQGVTGRAGGRVLAELLSVAGVGLIAYSLFFLDSSSPFPGINSLWPCLGTAALILAGQRGAWLSRSVLSMRGMVFVGLLSYSLYLWHWPILAFVRYFTGHVDAIAGVVSAALMFALAWLSYRYVEIPFRHWRPGKPTSFGVVWGLPLALIAVLSFGLLATDGLARQIEKSDSYAKRAEGLKAAVAPAYAYPYVCQASVTDEGVLDDPRCRLGGGEPSEDPRVLLWGDSKAAQYVGLFDEVGRAAGVSIRNAEHSSCPPVFADDRGGGRYRESCNRFWRVVRSGIASGRYDVVIMGGSWGSYDSADFRTEFRRTLDELSQSGARVVVLSDVPRYVGYNRSCLERSARLPWRVDCGARASSISGEPLPFEGYLDGLARGDPQRIAFLDTKRLLCPAGVCRGWAGGTPLYFDEGHISLEGGRLLGRELLRTPEAEHWMRAIRPESSSAFQ